MKNTKQSYTRSAFEKNTNRPSTPIDTIAAIATPPGRGGVGIVRVSGLNASSIVKNLIGFLPKERVATMSSFKNEDGSCIDEGLSLYFKNPHSFTGEDVVELHGHGGPVVMDQLLQRVVALGARLANPGEFSLRAFLNGKIDLLQAEAIAALIDASSVQAARSAVRSLHGEFSKKIDELIADLIRLRTFVEGAIDFPEEEIDFLADGAIKTKLFDLIHRIEKIQAQAKQGALLQEGIRVVIAGEPNVGKSSLLNRLSGRDSAIVTDIAGTTRDVLKESIHIDGMPMHVMDTAGLRESPDVIEQEGMKRAHREMETADMILLVTDATQETSGEKSLLPKLAEYRIPITVIKNKIDLLNENPRKYIDNDYPNIKLSVKTGLGIDLLKTHLKEHMGYCQTEEGTFISRRRHLDALQRAHDSLQNGATQLVNRGAGELLAEDLRRAQTSLSEITGEFTSDDLLGEIFSSFCIGK